ncbi:MAG TPA: DUF1501 domain-containing protein [Candidatus Kapabacteria bacterium]|nr:DUF1501 domain-containing protein [Candidatus Kapabacteria bacterium]
MQRRQFLKRTLQAGTILPLMSAGLVARPLGASFFPRAAAAGDRVLVLINLSGGNDGLNTVVPIDDAAYYTARQSLAIAKASTLPLQSGLGLHPAMTKVRELYDRGECAIVQSVGYPDQDRSHFRSTDIWHSGSDAAEVLYTGWLGRYLEKIHPEFPDELPSAPFAVQIASSLSLALQSDQGNMGIAIDNPDRFYNLANGLKVPDDPVPSTLAGPELTYVRSIVEQSNQFSTGINLAMTNGQTNVSYDGDSLSTQLKVVARLINGGLSTGIYVVTLGGFDTHTGQLTRHAQLLGQLSSAVSAFLADVAASGNGDRVAVATYSEFGRRVNENGSAGTDHGAAAPQFVFGRKVLGGTVLGGVPNLTDLDARGDIRFVNDYRQIYSSILEDWLGLDRADVNDALGGDFAKLPLFASSPGSATRESATYAGLLLEQNAPNPARTETTIGFSLPRIGRVSLELRTGDGRLVRHLVDRTLDAGAHRVALPVGSLASGRYLYTLAFDGYRISQWMTVVH